MSANLGVEAVNAANNLTQTCVERNVRPWLIVSAINTANQAARDGSTANHQAATAALSALLDACTERGIDAKKVTGRIHMSRVAGWKGFRVEARLDLIQPLVVSVATD